MQGLTYTAICNDAESYIKFFCAISGPSAVLQDTIKAFLYLIHQGTPPTFPTRDIDVIFCTRIS